MRSSHFLVLLGCACATAAASEAALSGCNGASPAATGGADASTVAPSGGAATGGATTGTGASGGGTGGAGAAGGAGATTGPAAGCPTSVGSQHLATPAHDPSLARAPGGSWVLFATGGTLRVRTSTDLVSWSDAGTVFPSVPPWVKASLGTPIAELWAPDISYFGGRYHLYYAGSTFGSNRSVIGLATAATLDPAGSSAAWVDQGLVLQSNAPGTSDDWNAIDPSLVLDEAGAPWLVFGSWWSGIKLRRVDPATGKLAAVDPTLYALAARAPSSGTRAIEAASIVRHGGYYHLFVSYDLCCKGTSSTYRTMAGRAAQITGPYLDRAGRSMAEGFAEELLATEGRYIGPGGGTAFEAEGCFYYTYHYYDGQAQGAPTLEMRPIGWSADGWPVLGEALWP